MAGESTAKKTRAKAGPKPVFVIYDGADDVSIVACTRSADKALELMDNNIGAKYKRVMLDAGK